MFFMKKTKKSENEKFEKYFERIYKKKRKKIKKSFLMNNESKN